jgi:hypothetical protein
MSVMTARASWVDELLTGQSLVSNLAQNARLSGAGGTSKPGPGDQALSAVILRFLAARGYGHLVIQLPRGAHDVATFCGLVLQVARGAAWANGDFRSLEAFGGPVLVIGTDTAVQRRLRAINLRGAHFGGGLAEGLSACRIRADGDIVTSEGEIAPYVAGGRRLLYLNTRIGWPNVDAYDGVAILDRTNLSIEAYRTALRWVEGRASRVITLSALGDAETPDVLGELGVKPDHMLFTPGVIDDLFYALGSGEGSNSLSTNALFARGPHRRPAWAPTWEIDIVEHDEVDEAIADAFSALAEAQSIEGTRPPMLRYASQLVSTLIRCPIEIGQYAKAAALDPWAKSPRSLARNLERRQAVFHGRWESFAATHWGRLRQAALTLYRLLDEHNPKADACVLTVHRLRRENPGARIRVRTANALTVPLLTAALVSADLDDGRIEVVPWSKKTPWLSADVEVWVGAPPWTQTTHVFGAEGVRKVAVLYEAEASMLRRRTARAVDSINSIRAETRNTLRLSDLRDEVCEWQMPQSQKRSTRSVDASVDLDRIADRVSELLTDIADGETTDPGSTRPSGEITRLIPLRFVDNTTWWIHPERAIGLLVGGKYRHALVTELQAGDVLVVPKGEGRDEIFARLVQARHAIDDMSDLDVLLGRFRLACRELWEKCGRNWSAVRRELESAGANATTQARAWAEGTTIAPEDPKDVRLIGKLVGDTRLENEWAAVAGIAAEIRSVHQQLGHIISHALTEVFEGRGGPNIEKLERLLGEDSVEALDEFILKRVAEVGEAQEVDARLEGQVI